MAAAMNVTYQTFITMVETPGTGVPALNSNQTITQSGFNKSLALTGVTAPSTVKGSALNVVLASGAATIDMTALVGAGGGAVSLNGNKPRIWRFQAPATNAAKITVRTGASNGYTGAGASFSVDVLPGGEFIWYDGGNATAVSGTLKTIDLAGTGSTDNLNVQIIGGN